MIKEYLVCAVVFVLIILIELFLILSYRGNVVPLEQITLKGIEFLVQIPFIPSFFCFWFLSNLVIGIM